MPPFLPGTILLRVGVTELLGVRDVANGGIKPDIEYLALSSLYGDRDAPVEVACHSARLKTAVEPRLALTIDVRAPLLVIVENPLAEPLFMLIQWEVPVLGSALDRSCT